MIRRNNIIQARIHGIKIINLIRNSSQKERELDDKLKKNREELMFFRKLIFEHTFHYYSYQIEWTYLTESR